MTHPVPPQLRAVHRRRWRDALRALGAGVSEFFSKDDLSISASIAFYTLLAIFPFFLLLLSLAGIFIHHYTLSGQLATVLNRYLPMKPDFIMRNLVIISKAHGRVGLVSLLLLLWGSSGVFVPLEKAMNSAWDVKQERVWWRSRLLALELALLGGLLTLLTLGLVILHLYVRQWMQHAMPGSLYPNIELLYRALISASAFGITLVMFLVLFRYLPNRELGFRQVFPSALLTSLFWEASRGGFTMMLRHFNYSHIYGPIGAMVALITWAYVSAAVMMLGARVSNRLYRTLYPEESAEAASHLWKNVSSMSS